MSCNRSKVKSFFNALHQRRPYLSVSLFSTSSDASFSWKNHPLMDTSNCFDDQIDPLDLQLMEEVITEEEEQIVAEECIKVLRRRRYERNHWDNVIINFKEMERSPSKWSQETRQILEKLHFLPILPKELTYFPQVHVIDLAEDGFIKPHIDSIKFSGCIVAGLSLLSPSIMRFQQENGTNYIEAMLPRRSFYCMTGKIRYHYTHEILPGQQIFKNQIPVERTRRISIMIRDEFVAPPTSLS
jgi:alkylated DNA repair protein alkB family protein 7